MKTLRYIFWALTTIMVACGPADSENSGGQDTEAPKGISVSPSSISATSDGGSFILDVTSPVRPVVSDIPSWASLSDGTYKNYRISYTVIVTANSEYEARSAELSISANGETVKVPVSQEAAQKPVTPVNPGTGEVESDVAWNLAAKMGLGWNMGNHMDAFYNGTWAGDNFLMPNETCWGAQPATQATFDGVKAAGFKSVRIPITWLKKIGPAPDYTIDAAWLNRVAEIVGYAEKAGLYVIINTHHDENHHSIKENGKDLDTRWLDILGASKSSEVNESIKKEITAVWTQIAEKFKDKGEWLIFESFNELNDGGWGWSASFRANPSIQCNILNEWNQVFVDAVRATGGNNATRWLGVPTYAANPSFVDYLTLPKDAAGKIMVSVHFYDPSEYTIGDSQYSDWGHTGDAAKKASGGDEDHVRSIFGKLTADYVNKGIPVYVGEFGCSMRSKSDTRAWAFFKYYMEYIVKAAKTYGLPPFLWDNGATGSGQEHHGYINHGTGGYIGNSKEIVDLIVNTMNNESESYTLETVYNKAPKF